MSIVLHLNLFGQYYNTPYATKSFHHRILNLDVTLCPIKLSEIGSKEKIQSKGNSDEVLSPNNTLITVYFGSSLMTYLSQLGFRS